MPTSWDPKSPRLLPAIVCYADILGFRAMTETALRLGKERKFLKRIKRSLACAYDQVRNAANLSGWVETPVFDMKVFTDNIVVAYPLRDPAEDLGEPELGTLLDLFMLVQLGLAVDGFFLRGGITAGQHYQDEDIVFGEALLEAVDLNKSGGSPRLVIGSSVDPLISKHLSWYRGLGSPHYEYLLEDPYDGRLFVNYLDAAFAHFPHGPIGHQLLSGHKDEVSKGLKNHNYGSSVWQKYAWLATYHNYVCNRFVNAFPVRYGDDIDHYEMAVTEEAQRVSDHLVPFEDYSAVKPPRQLDAKRLQMRLSKK